MAEAPRDGIGAKLAQIRAARQLLGWSQNALAHQAGISQGTVFRVERGIQVSAEALAAIVEAIERAGVMFVEENGERRGVRLRKRNR